MLILRLVTVFLLISLPAIANEDVPDFNVLCKYLNKSKPSIGLKPVVSADYVAGVDVYGHDVVSADVHGSAKSFLNDPLIIPIQLDLLERAGLDLPEGLFSDAVLGDVKLYADGRIILGDEDISDQTRSFCDAQKSGVQRDQEHGQKERDPLPSTDKIEGQYP